MPVSTESISDEIFAAGFNAYDYKKATMLFAVSLPNLTAYQVTIINPKDANSATTRSQINNISPAIRDIFAKEFLGK